MGVFDLPRLIDLMCQNIVNVAKVFCDEFESHDFQQMLTLPTIENSIPDLVSCNKPNFVQTLCKTTHRQQRPCDLFFSKRDKIDKIYETVPVFCTEVDLFLPT